MNPTFNPALYGIKRLEIGERIEHFDCGDEDLNDFILNDAPLYRRSLLAVTYAMAEKIDTSHVVAFCSLANDRVSLSDFESKTEFNRFRKSQQFPQEKRMKNYPAVKICRLGVDKSARGLSIGSGFLDFIKYYFLTDNKTGCRFLTVDAHRDALGFYLKCGFQYFTAADETDDTRLMYFDLKPFKDALS